MSNSLKCNAPTCGNDLGQGVSLLSCGHAFCAQHYVNSSCPLCNRKVSVLPANFSKKYINERKRLILVGFSPSEILEAAGNALEFWQSQKALEGQIAKSNEYAKEKFFKDKMMQAEQTLAMAQQGYNELRNQYKTLSKKYEELQQKNLQLERKSSPRFDPPSNHKFSESNFQMFSEFSDFKTFKRPFTPHGSNLFTPSRFQST